MVECSDNSTECILQNIYSVLKDTNDAYDWDPVTFGFTVGIGAIALWFAVVPILQGLFFPPEILKYNWAAIGEWTRKNEKKWFWGNMRYEITTRTPVLSISEIGNWKVDLSSQETSETASARLRKTFETAWLDILGAFKPPSRNKSQQDSEKAVTPEQLEHKTNKNGSPPHSEQITGKDGSSPDLPPPLALAGWVVLLRNLRIDKDVVKMGKTRAAPAGMIPSDIPAALAYGSVETFVILAVVAGCRTIVMDGKYPLCLGPGVQLDFRNHTSLGIIAAFSKYGTESAYGTTSFQDVKAAYSHGQGKLTYGGIDVESAFLSHKGYMQAEDENRPVLPDNVAKRLGIPYDSIGGIYLLAGDIPARVRVFPSRKLQVHAIVSALAVHHDLWMQWSGPLVDYPASTWSFHGSTKLSGASFAFVKLEYGKECYPQAVQNQKKVHYNTWLSYTMEYDRPKWPRSVEGDIRGHPYASKAKIEDSIIILQKALDACKTWLQNPTEFRTAAAEKDSRIQEFILLQLFELDYWLSECIKDPQTAGTFLENAGKFFFRATCLLKIGQGFEALPALPLEKSNPDVLNDEDTKGGNSVIAQIRNAFTRGDALEWEHGARLWVAAWRASGASISLAGQIVDYGVCRYRKDIELTALRETYREQSGMRFYLIFRAALYGALLDTAADNSCILDIGISQQIVPAI